MLAEGLAPNQLDKARDKFTTWVDPFYSKIAYKVFYKDKDSPDYENKVAEWKSFQERSLFNAGIVATAGITGNIATQKLLIGNPSPTKAILAGKLLSATITSAIGLSVRLAFPEQTKSLDRWVGKRVFTDWLEHKRSHDGNESSHADRLLQQDHTQSIQR